MKIVLKRFGVWPSGFIDNLKAEFHFVVINSKTIDGLARELGYSGEDDPLFRADPYVVKAAQTSGNWLRVYDVPSDNEGLLEHARIIQTSSNDEELCLDLLEERS